MSDFNVKYRPQKVAELDLVSVRNNLGEVLRSGNIPHAFLFSGSRGTGKTSAARIVAKAVNCESRNEKRETGNELEPCNKCEQCVSITNGNNLDVLEIDAASNRGIDDIRDLREKIRLAPSKAKFKVYIIDEVHMLTTEAFNALLKTLEEPPVHAIFILCTTEPEKLPETIVSRCFRLNFRRASQMEIVEKLKRIAEKESVKVEEEALTEIARAVSGSFRDATKTFEHASFAKSEITLGKIKEILGQTSGLEPQKLIEFLAVKDMRASINEINRVVDNGGNLRVYTQRLLEIMRLALLLKIGVELKEEKLEEVNLSIGEMKKIIEIFSKSALDLKDSVIPQLPLELAIIEWCGIPPNRSPQEEKTGDEGETISPEESGFVPSTEMASVTLESIKNKWSEVLLGVRPKNHSIEALLRSTRPLAVDGHTLTLEVFYQFHKDKLESEKCRKIVEETISEIFSTPISVRCTLGERKKPEVKADSDEDIIKVAEGIFSGVVK